jgi:hypothetical protein
MEAFPFEEQCTACPAGTFSDMEGASKCSQCEPGKYSTTEGSSDALDCVQCIDHADSPAGSEDESACFCKAGYGQVSNATASCEACVAGTYSEGRCFNKDEGVFGWDVCAWLENGGGDVDGYEE